MRSRLAALCSFCLLAALDALGPVGPLNALSPLSASPARAADPEPVVGGTGMVVSAQHLASDVGAMILHEGGNAVDAAVAVGYALAVVYPEAGNIGGGGFMTLRLADGRVTFLDFREKAPLAATASLFLDASGAVVPGRSTESWLGVGVPGTVLGLETARIRYGTLPRAALMAPAIRLARDGFILGQGDAEIFALEADKLALDPAAAAVFLPSGRVLRQGDRLVQTNLAETLDHISREGPDAFYRGAIGAAITAASRAGGGLLTPEDLARYRVRELKPVECEYRGYHIISAPPPSSGGVSLCETLQILQGYDLAAMGFHSAAEVHVLVEALRRVYVDRNTKLGDPAFVDNPVSELLTPAYAAAIRKAIDPLRATPSTSLGPPAKIPEGTNTTQYDVLDARGNAVSVTYTLNDWFGVHRIAGRTGVVMNNEMDDFTAKPGAPNMFGLVQGAANAIAPGKTPLSSMCPTIVTRNGEVVLIIGSPGGSRIITITLEAILNLVDHGMTVQQAIDAPRLHHQWLPDVVYLEPYALSPDTQALLEARGYAFKEEAPWGIAEGVLTGGPSLQPRRPLGGDASSPLRGAATLSPGPDGRLEPGTGAGLGGAGGAKMYGAHDVRGGAGSAAPAD